MNILLLSPHTDDVELGCGGSVTKLMESSPDLLWVVFSTADESLPENLPKDTLAREFSSVVTHLGLTSSSYTVFDFRVRELDQHRQQILDTLVDIGNDFHPDLVVGPSLKDLHQDHRVIANEMVRAFKMTSSIICYELPWNHVTFDTQMFIRLEEHHIAQKLRLLMSYESQLAKQRSYFSKEFVYGLAKTRGIQCNSDYAEAFEVIRWIM
jgi:LmbE family N-acetylglucosaminyl deacetylase